MNRRDFIKAIGVSTAGLVIAPSVVLAKPTSLEDLGFIKQKIVKQAYCDSTNYTREDGLMSILYYRDNKYTHAFWTPDFSRFNTWHYQTKDYQELIDQITKHVGYRYIPRNDWERLDRGMYKRGYKNSSNIWKIGHPDFGARIYTKEDYQVMVWHHREGTLAPGNATVYWTSRDVDPRGFTARSWAISYRDLLGWVK